MTSSQLTSLAMSLTHESGFLDLTVEQSWHIDKHLTPLQVAKYRASCALMDVVSQMERDADEIQSAAEAQAQDETEAWLDTGRAT